VEFGYFSHVWQKPSLTAGQRYQLLWRELALADQLGFDYGFTVEHHFRPDESLMPTPGIFCAAASMHTKRMRIGPMGWIVPLYDPLRIAEEVAVLDHMLDGRLQVGLVSGILPHYFTPYGADFPNRRARTNETISMLKAAFAEGGAFSFRGEFYKYEDVTLSVKPVQKPHPPMWLQTRDPETLALLAREGVNTGYLFFVAKHTAVPRYTEYLRQWRAAGHRADPRIAYWTLVYVDETDEKALEKAHRHVLHTWNDIGGFGDTGGVSSEVIADNLRKRGEPESAEIVSHISDLPYLMERNLVFVGSTETVARQIRQAATEGMFNVLLGEFNFGYLDETDVMRSVRLFGEQVMPRLRDLEVLPAQ
jgi:alkanesulfonate monooxygenase SsuD/methylene tetrahydromethanopterin reductase-like flavin-dependent oxidoreductase (luciferase family)